MPRRKISRSKNATRRKRKSTRKRSPCSVCGKPANRVSYRLCETCYYRKRRTGSTEYTPNYRYRAKHGYWVVIMPDHPLAGKQGKLYEHRKVLYDKLGPGPQECYWCGRILKKWKEITVDHLNSKKDDNNPENLVSSCNSCNRYRGRINAILNRIKPERIPDLLRHSFGIVSYDDIQKAESGKDSGR